MSYIPRFNVITWSAYEISKFQFYTKSKDDLSTMQNNGVMVDAKSMYFSSSKDNNLVMTYILYFGVIQEIQKIYHVIFIVSLFKCKWIDNNTSIQGWIRVHTCWPSQGGLYKRIIHHGIPKKTCFLYHWSF